MDRKDVYKVIDGEREYQIARHEKIAKDNPHSDENHSVADWITYMEHHLEEAKKGVYFLNTDEALSQLRKVVALGVACFEYKGVPERV